MHAYTFILFLYSQIYLFRFLYNITFMIMYVQGDFLQPPHATNNTDVEIKKGIQIRLPNER